MPPERMVPTPKGDARLVTRRAKRPLAMLVLTHGAGGGIDAPDLVRLARTLPQQDISVTLVGDAVASRRQEARPGSGSDRRVLHRRARRHAHAQPAGARWPQRGRPVRVPDRRGVGARGVLALSFPLHPPGRPEKSRLDELLRHPGADAGVQGERDPFGTPEEFPDGIDLAVVPGADHSMKVPRSARAEPGRRAGRRPRGHPGVGGARDRGESKQLRSCSLQ